MHDPCTHADAIQLVDPPLEVCEACVEIGRHLGSTSASASPAAGRCAATTAPTAT